MNNNLVQSIKLTPKGTYFGKQFIPLTPQQVLVEKTWEQFLDSTLGPELQNRRTGSPGAGLKKIQRDLRTKIGKPFFLGKLGAHLGRIFEKESEPRTSIVKPPGSVRNLS